MFKSLSSIYFGGPRGNRPSSHPHLRRHTHTHPRVSTSTTLSTANDRTGTTRSRVTALESCLGDRRRGFLLSVCSQT